jgi:hypothetical protein
MKVTKSVKASLLLAGILMAQGCVSLKDALVPRESCEKQAEIEILKLQKEKGCFVYTGDKPMKSSEEMPPSAAHFFTCAQSEEALYFVNEKDAKLLKVKPAEIKKIGECTNEEYGDYSIFSGSAPNNNKEKKA